MALWYDKKAYALLKKCSDARDLTEWNRYREETNYAPINLRFLDLSGLNLDNANLKNIDFRGADLYLTSFDKSNIENSNFSQTFYWVSYLLVSFIVGISVWLNFDVQHIIGRIFYYFFFFSSAVIFLSLIFDWNFKLPILSILYIVMLISLGVLFGFSVGNIKTPTFINIGISIAIGIGSILLYKFNAIYVGTQKRIALSKNPEKAIGFDTKYLKDISIPLSSRSENEIAVIKELLEKEQDEKEKQALQHKLEELQKEKEHALKTEAHAKTQQIKIQNALNHILKPYEYMERNISKLRKHNYFFYGVILILLGAFVYALSAHYLDVRSNQFLDVLEKDTVSFGALFGVILFYATPILFGMSIIIYAIAQINKNIQSIEAMQEQRRSIEVLKSTLLAQTEIADVSDDEIKALTQALQKGALEKMFGKEKPTEKTPKEKSTYREKLLITNLSKALTQALK